MDQKLELEISKKLNVLISLSLKQAMGDADFATAAKRRQGTGDLARFLDSFGLDSRDISEILGAPLASVRTLLTPKRRK